MYDRKSSSRKSRRVPKGIGAVDLLKSKVRPVRWIVDQLIKPGLVLFAGAGKLGKTAASAELLYACGTSNAQAFGELDVQHGTAIYLALEDSRARFADRLRRISEGRPEPTHLRLFLSWPVLDSAGLAKLDALVEAQRPRVRMVCVDTIALCRPQGKTGYLKDYAFARTLQRWALRRRLALICVTHLTKNSHKDFAADVAGSMGAFSSCDTLLHLSRARGEQRALLRVVSRETGEKEIPLEMTNDGLWRIAPDGEETWLSPERKAIKAALHEEPLGPKSVALKTGLPEGSVRVLMSKMVKLGQLQRVGRGRYVLPGPQRSAVPTSDNVVNVNDQEDESGDQNAPHAPVVSINDLVTARANDDDGVIH